MLAVLRLVDIELINLVLLNMLNKISSMLNKISSGLMNSINLIR